MRLGSNLKVKQWQGAALRRGLLCLVTLVGVTLHAQAPEKVANGVWFLLGDAAKGYSNTVVIEMQDYLIVVDANYPGRAKELIALMPSLSPKPVRYVFDTHAHGDHSYGNSTWTRAEATTVAFAGVTAEMDRWEPARWQAAKAKRADVQATGEDNVERPKLSLRGDRMVLKDASREVDLLFLGWGHTPGDGFVWLPKERILATGDAAGQRAAEQACGRGNRELAQGAGEGDRAAAEGCSTGPWASRRRGDVAGAAEIFDGSLRRGRYGDQSREAAR